MPGLAPLSFRWPCLQDDGFPFLDRRFVSQIRQSPDEDVRYAKPVKRIMDSQFLVSDPILFGGCLPSFLGTTLRGWAGWATVRRVTYRVIECWRFLRCPEPSGATSMAYVEISGSASSSPSRLGSIRTAVFHSGNRLAPYLPSRRSHEPSPIGGASMVRTVDTFSIGFLPMANEPLKDFSTVRKFSVITNPESVPPILSTH